VIKYMKLFSIIALALASMTNACAEPVRLEPGVYENLLLAVDSNGEVSGYYREAQGEGAVKTCSFSFRGEASADVVTIFIDMDKSFQGEISAEADGIRLKIPKGRELPGCGLVLMPEIADGLSYDLISKAPWKELRTIVSEKSHFYSKPNLDKKLKSYLVKGDVVGVVMEEGDWLQVDYYSDSGKMSRRWVNRKETRSLLTQ
jgi:hypothetical protein